MSLKYVTVPLEVRSLGERVIEGYASTFGDVDSYGTRFAPHAFDRTLKERTPAVLVGHDTTQLPIGTPVEMRVDKTGLFTRTSIAPGPAGDELLSRVDWLLENRQSVGLSVGFRTEKSSWDGDVMVIEEAALYEYSFVTFPANAGAKVTSVRNEDDFNPAATLERAIEALQQARDDIARRVDAAVTLGDDPEKRALDEPLIHALRNARRHIADVLGETEPPAETDAREEDQPPDDESPMSDEQRTALVDELLARRKKESAA